ncbi:hypothetical protein ACFYYM_31335 [Streptomyces erythrochromogenes]|uniref:hypothetical protein n=1 Tax=Streptomyces erythrochromogenes TaxID=285574 RepID=UPI0036B5E9C6
MTVATRERRCPYAVGDVVTGTTYVEPSERGHTTPQEFTGEVVQIGSGWAGVDAPTAYLWARLPSGLEVKALIQDCERTTR